MIRVLLFLAAFVFVIPATAAAQTCADVNGSGGFVDIGDWVFMIQDALGVGAAIQDGKGDFDFRQGINVGDIRYLQGYIFFGYPTPGCPPFAPYTVASTNDTLILKSIAVPAGSGKFDFSIEMITHSPLADILVPLVTTTLGGTVKFDSIHQVIPYGQARFFREAHASVPNTASFYLTTAEFPEEGPQGLPPGRIELCRVFMSLTNCPGGVVTLDTTTLNPHSFLNYVFGANVKNYSTLTIGVPTVVIESYELPHMSLGVDTLTFDAAVGGTSPASQTFMVGTDYDSFNWTLTHPSWATVTPVSGASGQTVTVSPDITGLGEGTYYGNVVVSTGGAQNSPQTVTIKLVVNEPPIMTLSVDSLVFEAMPGQPAPPSQTFTVQTWSYPFNWTLTTPLWLTATPAAGTSGQTVTVTANLAGLMTGRYTGDILVFSNWAQGSPRNIAVNLKYGSTSVSFDADCSGSFDIGDIVYLITYIFGGGPDPCIPGGGK